MALITGVVHPAQTEDVPHLRDLDPKAFTVDQLRRMRLSGLPVYDEHRYDGDPLGEVTFERKTPDNAVHITARLHGRTPASRRLIDEIESGQKRELSLAHLFRAQGTSVPGIEHQRRQLAEVSVTKKGYRQNCHITHFKRLAPKTATREHSRSSQLVQCSEKLSKMSESASAIAATPEVDETSELLKAMEGMSKDQIAKIMLKMKQDAAELAQQNMELAQRQQESLAVQQEMARRKAEEIASNFKACSTEVSEEQKAVFAALPHQVLDLVVQCSAGVATDKRNTMEQLRAEREKRAAESKDGDAAYQRVLQTLNVRGLEQPPGKRFSSEMDLQRQQQQQQQQTDVLAAARARAAEQAAALAAQQQAVAQNTQLSEEGSALAQMLWNRPMTAVSQDALAKLKNQKTFV